MKSYPLVFGPRDLIQGNGFLAGVEAGEQQYHAEDTISEQKEAC